MSDKSARAARGAKGHSDISQGKTPNPKAAQSGPKRPKARLCHTACHEMTGLSAAGGHAGFRGLEADGGAIAIHEAQASMEAI